MCLFRQVLVCLCLRVAYGSTMWRHGVGASSHRSNGRGDVNYANVRARVAHGFAEKANEIAETIAVLQDIAIATVDLTDKISARCSSERSGLHAATGTP